ncbi:hypothetical protein T265_03258 [Opisthorchis viverrini]|uniref:Uncharacterized protein n=1 Tax=Opisthorchis viverrini TaxID=6198 RepID=A0A074ZSB0_OPIVI|nr:hypothetical protein T265_03258 [Opisthorchis viverrini]KER30313.1 hypothetical protein T265_03258 [Opisthorchis viverrini]
MWGKLLVPEQAMFQSSLCPGAIVPTGIHIEWGNIEWEMLPQVAVASLSHYRQSGGIRDQNCFTVPQLGTRLATQARAACRSSIQMSCDWPKLWIEQSNTVHSPPKAGYECCVQKTLEIPEVCDLISFI